jgi:hypothetical protein
MKSPNSTSSTPPSSPYKDEDVTKYSKKLSEEVTYNEKFQFLKVETRIKIARNDKADIIFEEIINKTIEDNIEKAKEHDVELKFLGIRIFSHRPKMEHGIPIGKFYCKNLAVHDFMRVHLRRRPIYGNHGKPFKLTVTIVGDPLNKAR